MCLIGDFVLAGNEGLNFRQPDSWRKRQSEGQVLNYTRPPLYVTNTVEIKSLDISLCSTDAFTCKVSEGHL